MVGQLGSLRRELGDLALVRGDVAPLCVALLRHPFEPVGGLMGRQLRGVELVERVLDVGVVVDAVLGDGPGSQDDRGGDRRGQGEGHEDRGDTSRTHRVSLGRSRGACQQRSLPPLHHHGSHVQGAHGALVHVLGAPGMVGLPPNARKDDPMAQRSEYAPGTPSWIDIGTDIEGAKAFYGPLFGWESEDAGPVEETGGYGFFTKNGGTVAGYGPQQNPGPPFWTTYISVADVDDTAKKVEAAGGTVVVAPMDVMTAGRMAVFQDPQGGFVSAWQPQEHHGASVVNEPGSWCWSELHSRDVDGSKAFYEQAFGWSSETHGGEMPYTEFSIDGRTFAGMMAMMPTIPPQVPTFWLSYFAVDDTDASVAKVQELGGSVMMPAMDVATVGRFAIVGDPQGAAFGLITLNQPAE